MEKHNQKEEDKEKAKWLYPVIALLIIIVVVGAIVGGIYLGVQYSKQLKAKEELKKNTILYNGFIFQKQGDVWYTTIQIGPQPYTIPFYYNPKELENVTIDDKVITRIQRAKVFGTGDIYLTMKPTDPSSVAVASIEIGRILGTKYNIMNFNVTTAITEPLENVSRPIVTCKNGSIQTLVMYVTLLEETPSNVELQNSENCIIIHGQTYEDLLKFSDKLSYMLLGIIKTKNSGNQTRI